MASKDEEKSAKAEPKAAKEESGYAQSAEDLAGGGKPVGPEHDKSFHVYEFEEPEAKS